MHVFWHFMQSLLIFVKIINKKIHMKVSDYLELKLDDKAQSFHHSRLNHKS